MQLERVLVVLLVVLDEASYPLQLSEVFVKVLRDVGPDEFLQLAHIVGIHRDVI